MNHIIEQLKERGLYAQSIHEEELADHLKEKRTIYAGFDPTADSLHAGSLLPAMILKRWQEAGHRVIALVGGATAYIGDPTGKSDLRQMMTTETIQKNIEGIKAQLSKIIDLSDPNKGLLVNNADWLKPLNYLEFVRDYGVHFNVNRMLQAECYKQRMEAGLTFLEFNYMILQSYDFFYLNQKYGCSIQVGGDDQWSNMLGGVSLVRKIKQDKAFCITSPLLLTSDGKKMGKTEKGAVWLDPQKTSPYDFYQYWRNTPDADVRQCLLFLTQVPAEKVHDLTKVMDKEINLAKELLAFEVTKLVHGEDEANKAQEQAKTLFASGAAGQGEAPHATILASDLGAGIDVVSLLALAKITDSKGEARRLIQQGGVSFDGKKVEDVGQVITPEAIKSVEDYMVKVGKKKFFKLVIG